MQYCAKHGAMLTNINGQMACPICHTEDNPPAGDNSPDLEPLFEKCVVRSHKDGWHTIKCKLGLWSASGGDKQVVEHTAHHYWIQYYGDGEYEKILKQNA